MRALRILVWLVLLAMMLALVGFVVQNPGQAVDIHLFQRYYEGLPLVVALFAAFLVGVIVALVFGAYFLFEQSLAVRRLRLLNRELDRELDSLRNLAVEEGLPLPPAPPPATPQISLLQELEDARERAEGLR